MKKYITATALIMVWSVLFAAKADANYMTGNDLYSECESRKAECVAYILGAVDTQEAFDESATTENQPARKRFVCQPSNVNAGQLVAIVMKWMQDRPAERHWSAAILVRNAMVSAFPCR